MRTLDLEPLDATFGAVVRGVKLASIDEPTWQALHAAWLQYALLIFPEQHLQRDQQIAFAKRFGPLEFDMAAISNVRANGTLRREADNDDVVKVLKGNMGWHADSTYMPVQAKGAVFSAEVVPSAGGQTGFADMRAAYDALDDATRAKVDRLQAYHSLHYSQSKLGHQHQQGSAYSGYGFHDGPVPLRPLVKTPPRHRPQVAADRAPCARHPGHGPGRVRALPGFADRIRLPAAPGGTTTTGRPATRSSGTTAACCTAPPPGT
jgi:alpha-ketoglutarate-dependent taurine dioxygenase